MSFAQHRTLQSIDAETFEMRVWMNPLVPGIIFPLVLETKVWQMFLAWVQSNLLCHCYSDEALNGCSDGKYLKFTVHHVCPPLFSCYQTCSNVICPTRPNQPISNLRCKCSLLRSFQLSIHHPRLQWSSLT